MTRHLLVLLVPFVLALTACSHGNCKTQKEGDKSVKAGVVVDNSSSTDRIKVYKADGTLQCGQGKKVSLEDMQKDLGSLKVYSSFNKNDGMMRIQVCGSPTGNSNVYEIDRKDLEAALKAGFKQWTAE